MGLEDILPVRRLELALESLGVYQGRSLEERIKKMNADRKLREGALDSSFPFISKEFDNFYRLTQGLVLVGACSGTGKSTTCANLIYGFITSCKDGEAIVISNEESSEAVYARVACLSLNENFFSYYKNLLSSDRVDKIQKKMYQVAERVDIVDEPYDTSCIEDIKKVLEFAENSKKQVRLVVLDYFQTVNRSKSNEQKEPFAVLKELGFYLKEYGKRVGVPVVVFAQLKPKSESPDFSARVQNDRTIYNHAFSVIEIVPDFKTRKTSFILHKDRFGLVQGKEIVVDYVDGKYENMDI